jgi:predicted ferric reductase
MFSRYILFIGLLLVSNINAGDIGLVGLGRTIFEPLCCYACLSSLWGLDLSCTAFQPNPTQQRGSDPFCHSTNTPYLASLAYCLQIKCAADNVASSVTEQCWAKVAGDGLPAGTLQEHLPNTVPNVTLLYDATTLDQTSLVDEQYYEDSWKTIQGYVKQESTHALYGLVLEFAIQGRVFTNSRIRTILIAVVVGFCFSLGILRLINYASPNLSLPRPISSLFAKYISLPALFGSMHLHKLPGNIGYVPSRALTLLILCYVALNAVLCAINYPTLTPDTWYISNQKQKTSWVADRLGVLCFANIALTIMFSGRNTPLLWITGCSRSDIITFHRWVARITALEGIIHVALYWTTTNSNGDKMFTLAAGIHTVNYNASYWSHGIVAVIAMAFMVVLFSMLPLRTKIYETFVFLHIVLAIIILVGLWYHVADRYHKAYGYEIWLYIAFAFWGFDRVSRPLRIILLNWKSWFLPSHPSAVVELLPGDEFIKVTVFPSLIWNFSAGQHCYLYFPNLKTNPFQSHPFSIGSWNIGLLSEQQRTPNEISPSIDPGYPPPALPRHSTHNSIEPIIELQEFPLNNTSQSPTSILPSKPSISFILRPEHGVTRHLHNRLLKSRKEKISVIIEGPYGSAPSTKLNHADTILAIGGGIGITSILGYLQLYLSETEKGRKRRPSRLILFWTAREESLIAAVKSQIGDLEELKAKGVEVRIVCTGIGDEARVGVGEVVQREVLSEGGKRRKVCVVCCGPGALADGVRKSVVGVVGKKGVSVDLVEEAFCW